MHCLRSSAVCVGMLILAATSYAAELSIQQKKELTVFSGRAMGTQVGVGDVKEVLSRSDIEHLVATGINLNGHLCAQIVDIRPLKVSGAYEVSCIAYRGGSAKKSYVLDALKGVAFEP
jgi:hypothetical protein